MRVPSQPEYVICIMWYSVSLDDIGYVMRSDGLKKLTLIYCISFGRLRGEELERVMKNSSDIDTKLEVLYGETLFDLNTFRQLQLFASGWCKLY